MDIETQNDLRKIQVTGGSTYIISLPKTWVDQMGLKRGSIVSIARGDDLSLCIQPKEAEIMERVKKAIITTTEFDTPEKVIRRLVSSYLVGYNIIQLRSNQKRIDTNIRFAVKDFVRKKLVGTEILSDLPGELTLQILLSYTELSVKDALRRMVVIAASMHKDALSSLNSDNQRIAKEIISTDDEVDRFSLYIVRLLKVAVVNSQILREIGLENPRQCLGYRLITKSVERMADHAVNIAENGLALTLSPLTDDIVKELEKISESALKVFEDAMEAVFDEDYLEADKVMDNAEETRGMEAEVIHKIIKLAPLEDVPPLRLIVESIMRTAEYGSDVADVVLNMTIQDIITEI